MYVRYVPSHETHVEHALGIACLAAMKHALKEVTFLGRKVNILLEASGGPCALVAIGAPAPPAPALVRARAGRALPHAQRRRSAPSPLQPTSSCCATACSSKRAAR
jgi:hypothetical protein